MEDYFHPNVSISPPKKQALTLIKRRSAINRAKYYPPGPLSYPLPYTLRLTVTTLAVAP